MKIVIIIFVVTILSAFIGSPDTTIQSESIGYIQQRIDSFNTQTRINQALFKLKIKDILNPKK